MAPNENFDPNPYNVIEQFFEASVEGDSEAVKNFLAGGTVDVNSQDKIFGETALHQASKNGHMGIVELLLSSNADPTMKTKVGKTPMHYASTQGHINIMKLLYDTGADLKAQDMHLLTPLHEVNILKNICIFWKFGT